MQLWTQSDLEESASALKSAQEQAKRSASDVAHLSDELRQQNDRNATLEKQRRMHEAQIKELQVVTHARIQLDSTTRTRPDPTRPDPGLRQSLRTLSGRVRSGRTRVVEFSSFGTSAVAN